MKGLFDRDWRYACGAGSVGLVLFFYGLCVLIPGCILRQWSYAALGTLLSVVGFILILSIQDTRPFLAPYRYMVDVPLMLTVWLGLFLLAKVGSPEGIKILLITIWAWWFLCCILRYPATRMGDYIEKRFFSKKD